MTETQKDELLELSHGYIEKRLSPEELERLENWLASDEAARRLFVDFSHDHALLHWENIPESGDSSAKEIDGLSDFRPRRLPTLWQTFAAAAIISLLALVLIRPPSDPDTFAIMESTESARWESATLPTSEGARLGQGTLHLVRGLATIVFDSGAEVILEAPAILEITDEMNCTLTKGTAVAEVSKGAEGFTIHTPTVRVVDFGTRFAVNVHPTSGATRTEVFDGLVEVRLPEEEEGIRLETGQQTLVRGDGIGQVKEGLEEGTWSSNASSRSRDPRWQLISTSVGKGKDSYVWAGEPNDHVSEELLLLKNSLDLSGPHRKAYLGFDLSSIPSGSIEDAELVLRFAPTGWGLASHLDSSDFQVWGITEDELDSWEHGSFDWDTAPANDRSDGYQLIREQAQLLGEFRVPRGIQSGSFGISGQSLTAFLNQDSNRLVSLVVTRKTQENRAGGLVHAFASHRHPYLPAPLLRVKTQP